MNDEQRRRFDRRSAQLARHKDLSRAELQFLLLLRAHVVLLDMTQVTLARRAGLGLKADGKLQEQRMSAVFNGSEPAPDEVLDVLASEFARKFRRPEREVRAQLESARAAAASARTQRRREGQLAAVARGGRALTAQEQAQLVVELSGLRSELTELHRTYQRLASTGAQQSQLTADLQRQVLVLGEEVAELNAELAVSTRALKDEQEQGRRLQDRLETTEQDLATSQAREAELKGLAEQRERELTESRAYGAEQERRRLALRAEADQLLAEIETLRAQLTQDGPVREGPSPEYPDSPLTSDNATADSSGDPLVPGVPDETIETLIDALQRGRPSREPTVAGLEHKVVRHVEAAMLPTGLLVPGTRSWTPGRSGLASSTGTLWVGAGCATWLVVVFLAAFGSAVWDSLPQSWSGLPAGVLALAVTLGLLTVPAVRRVPHARTLAGLGAIAAPALTLYLGVHGNIALALLASLIVLGAGAWTWFALGWVQDAENHFDEVKVFADEEVYGPSQKLRAQVGATQRFHRSDNSKVPFTLAMVDGRLRVSHGFRKVDFTISRTPSVLTRAERPAIRAVRPADRVDLTKCARLYLDTRSPGTATIEKIVVWLWDEGEILREGDPFALTYVEDNEGDWKALYWALSPIDAKIVRIPERNKNRGVRGDIFLAPLVSSPATSPRPPVGDQLRVEARQGRVYLDRNNRKATKDGVHVVS